jgi:hypothetical protein
MYWGGARGAGSIVHHLSYDNHNLQHGLDYCQHGVAYILITGREAPDSKSCYILGQCSWRLLLVLVFPQHPRRERRIVASCSAKYINYRISPNFFSLFSSYPSCAHSPPLTSTFDSVFTLLFHFPSYDQALWLSLPPSGLRRC